MTHHNGVERPVKGVRQATSRVLEEVRWERYRQEQLWGQQDHPNGTGPYILGDVMVDGRHRYALGLERWAKRRCVTEHAGGRGTYEHILTEEWAEVVASADPHRLRAELVQLAAVAVGWVAKISTGTWLLGVAR